MTLFGRTYPSEDAAERAHRRRWILFPGVVVLLCVVVGMVTTLGPFRTHEAAITRTYPAGITKIEVESPGELDMVGTSASRVQAEWQTHWNYRRPAVRGTRDGDTMRLRLDCSTSVGVECSADLRLAVPENVAVSVTSASGDITARGIDAPVSVDSKSGEVRLEEISGGVHLTSLSGDATLRGIGGDVTAETKSGEIRAEGLRGKTARFDALSGDIHAGFGVVPRRVTTDTKSGETRVQVPKGSGPYRVRTDVRSGAVHSDVGTDPSAPNVIDATALSGDVRIGYADGQYQRRVPREPHGPREPQEPPEPPEPPN